MRIFTVCSDCDHEWMRKKGVYRCPKCKVTLGKKNVNRGWDKLEIGEELHLPFSTSENAVKENMRQYNSLRSYCRKTGKVLHSFFDNSNGRWGMTVKRIS